MSKLKKSNKIKEKKNHSKKSHEKKKDVVVHETVHIVEEQKKDGKSRLTELFVMKLRNQFSAFLLILIGLFTLSFIGAVFYARLTMPKNIAKFLPADTTIALVEFHAKARMGDDERLGKFLTSEALPFSDLKTLFETSFGLDLGKDIAPWLGFNHGAALMKAGDYENFSYDFIFFIETNSKSETLETLKKLTLKSQKDTITDAVYKDFPYYYFSVGQNLYFMMLDDYVVFVTSEKAMTNLIDGLVEKSKKVIADENYQRIRNNVNKGNLFLYYKPHDLASFVVSKYPSYLNTFYLPIIGLFDSGGNSAFLDEDKLVLQSYLHLKDEPGESLRAHRPKTYHPTLLAQIPEDYEYLWGSREVSGIIADFGGLLNHLHPSSYNILEGVLNAYKEKYFGETVDLKNDVYTIFEDEFLLALYAKPEKVDYLFLAKNQKSERVEKLKNAYVQVVGDDESDVSLNQDEATKEEDKKFGISTLPFDGQSKLYVALQGTTLVLSTDRARLKSVLKNEVKKDVPELVLKKYLASFDEVNIMSPVFMAELLPESYGKIFRGIKRIEAGKSIFPDGVAVVHVFEF